MKNQLKQEIIEGARELVQAIFDVGASRFDERELAENLSSKISQYESLVEQEVRGGRDVDEDLGGSR